MFKKKLKKVIMIDGMSCNHCSKKVENTLNSLDNVIKTKVNLDKKQAIITLDKDIDDSMIIDAINHLGYYVTGISGDEK